MHWKVNIAIVSRWYFFHLYIYGLATGYVEDAELTEVNAMFFELLLGNNQEVQGATQILKLECRHSEEG